MIIIDPKAVEAVVQAICEAGFLYKNETDGDLMVRLSEAAISTYHAYLAEQGVVIQQGWQPIETAPKEDGMYVDLFVKGWGRLPDCFWSKEKGWWGTSIGRIPMHNQVSHWMPKPLPPTEQETEE